MDSTLTFWTGPFPIKRVSGYLLLLLPCFIEISIFNANSEAPDQTPRYAASDLDIHWLPMSLGRINVVNIISEIR